MNKVEQQIKSIHSQIASCASGCGRSQEDIKLVAVSKYATIEQIQQAYHFGIRLFAESRVLEAVRRKQLLPPDISWHFIGRIQSNKIHKMIGQFALIHSVADLKVAQALSSQSMEQGLIQPVLLQVKITDDVNKQGFASDEMLNCWDQLSCLPGIYIQGLMTMAPHTEDVDVIRHCFHSLADLQTVLNKSGGRLRELSMGMSSDFHVAIEEGSTLIRIGSLIFSSDKQ
ncbi:MAG: YggS family pyridoxal phosphate-dependent enzyme [Chlamydiae bacterium]|nr:YggS family pyridoxal phosphate-dependent enzyme [Chlamydiota bacterium]